MNSPPDLPSIQYHLKPATEDDDPSIKALIHAVGINPMGLAWQRFLLAVTSEGQMIGCGQIKPHRDGTRELASIAVSANFRGRGVASAIIQALINQHFSNSQQPLYLTCRAPLGPFYQRFGFQAQAVDHLPPYFRRINRLALTMKNLHIFETDLLVMKLDYPAH